MGAVGALVAVVELASRRRGSRARWRVEVARRGMAGSDGRYLVSLDSSEWPPDRRGQGTSFGRRAERLEAERIAVERAKEGIDPVSGWDTWPLEWEDFQAEYSEKMPSLRDLKEDQ